MAVFLTKYKSLRQTATCNTNHRSKYHVPERTKSCGPQESQWNHVKPTFGFPSEFLASTAQETRTWTNSAWCFLSFFSVIQVFWSFVEVRISKWADLNFMGLHLKTLPLPCSQENRSTAVSKCSFLCFSFSVALSVLDQNPARIQYKTAFFSGDKPCCCQKKSSLNPVYETSRFSLLKIWQL